MIAIFVQMRDKYFFLQVNNFFMKRILSCLYASMFLYPVNIFAQSISVADKNEIATAYYYTDTKNNITSNVPLNELSAKAYRHFEKNYADIDKETWTKFSGGTVVTFTNNSAFCKIFYDTRGDFVYSYKYYDQKNCRVELTKMLQRVYPQYKIISVVEIFDGYKPVYGINISNGKITKSLEIKDDEIKVLNEFEGQ
jgi:hypothetical protein